MNWQNISILVIIIIFSIGACWTSIFLESIKRGVEEIWSIAELLEEPEYDTNTKIYGKVSLLGELFCPCFNLTSGGETITVWYNLMLKDDGTQRIPVSIGEIKNGDWVIVSGEVKKEGKYASLNDFWAVNVEKMSDPDIVFYSIDDCAIM